MKIWPEILKCVDRPVFFSNKGSLVIAHPRDRLELERLARKVSENKSAQMRHVDAEEIKALEPELRRDFSDGLYFPREGQIDNTGVLLALREKLERSIDCRFDSPVKDICPHRMATSRGEERFDTILDCTGLAAKRDLPSLRGVRGELLILETQEVHLGRPIRLMHPRYPVYVVPRPGGRYVVGATLIESEDMGPTTVRSTLELLSAAYSIHSGFAEAKLIESRIGLRPSFPDNLPRFYSEPGLLRINGLYRHGFLIAPRLVELAVDFLQNGRVPSTRDLQFEAAA